MQKKKNRNYLFDNMKVVLIFFVVAAHFIRISGHFDPTDFGGVFYTISFAFIMQGFFFVSGYFSHNTEKCRRGAVKAFLLPYFVISTIIYVAEYLITGETVVNYLRPRFGLWFLLAMFTYRFMIRDLSKIPHILPISFILYFASGCFPFLGKELALGRIFAFLFFFIAGYSFKWEYIENFRAVSKRLTLVVAGFLIAASSFIAEFDMIPVEMWHLKESYSVYGISNIEGMLLRLIMFMMTAGWLFVITSLTPDKKIYVSDIGAMTVTVFVCHLPIPNILKYVSIPFDNSFLVYGSCIALALVVIYLFSRPCVFNTYNKMMNTAYNVTVVPVHKTYKMLFS